MKFTTLALTILSAAGVIAAPFEADRRAPIYTLRVSSRSRTLDGKYLAINGTTVGIFKSPSTAVRFTPYTDPSTGLAELRSTSSSSGEALALLGSNGLLDLASVPDPASITVPRGTVLDWRSFRLAGSTDEDEGEVAGALAYAAGGNKVGGWVAFPSGNAGGEWSVKWKDEEAVTIQNYQQIKVVYERVRRAN